MLNKSKKHIKLHFESAFILYYVLRTPFFQTIFKTFLKNKEKIVNALQIPYSNAKLEATNNLIKLIKRNAFGFRNFENFKKRIFIALNIKKERTKCVLSRS
ncbi:transposase [Streptococcus parasanguinis]|uniref:transposase n=1 Tax=Streptococcus parasanguinis TaxID=1318 RepID=UPI00399D57F2